MRSYLLVFNGDQATHEFVKRRIDTIDAITDWLLFFDNAFCVVSELEISELNDRIQAAIPRIQFVLTTLEMGKRKGWLPRTVWNFMNGRTPVHVEPA